MNIYAFPPIRLLIDAAYWVVTGISSALEPLAGVHSAALAVVILTIIVRALLIPVGISQVKAGITRKRLAPKITELQAKYKKSPELRQQKLMELYKEENASPLAGCLPVLAQIPVLMSVYGLFINSTISGQTNELLGHTLFGIPLSAKFLGLLTAGDLTGPSIVVYLILVVIIAVVAGFSRHLLMPATPETPAVSAARSASDAPTMPDLSGLSRTLSFMPFLTAIFALFVPLAAALYLVTDHHVDAVRTSRAQPPPRRERAGEELSRT